MKKLNLIITLVVSFFYVSCSVDNSVNDELSKSQINSRKLTDQLQIDKVISLVKGARKQSSFSRISSEQYNFDEIQIVSLDSNHEAVVVNAYSFDVNNDENNSIMLGYDGEVYGTPMVIRTTVNGQIKTLDIEDVDGTIMNTVVFDTQNQTTTLTYRRKLPFSQCGQNVADCVADVYSNHGWASVAAGVVSTFYPATIVAYTGSCVVKNCY